MWPLTAGPCPLLLWRSRSKAGTGAQAEPALTTPSSHSAVDDNPDFDNLDIVARDEEERYFDEEEPEDAPSPEPDGD